MGVTGPTAARDVPGGARDLWEGTGAMDSACGQMENALILELLQVFFLLVLTQCLDSI